MVNINEFNIDEFKKLTISISCFARIFEISGMGTVGPSMSLFFDDDCKRRSGYQLIANYLETTAYIKKPVENYCCDYAIKYNGVTFFFEANQ